MNSEKIINSFAASCCGTLGELYQGPLFKKDATEISIISALSNNKTVAHFTIGDTCNLEAINKIKVKKALNNFFKKFYEKEIKGQWTFESDIRMGAGMASSTSDIISALRCVSKALNKPLTLDDITNCLIGVERSDSVFINYPCLYLSQQQKIIELFSPQEKIFCIYGLEENTIDTWGTHDMLVSHYNDEKEKYKKLANEVYNAFYSKDLLKIIRCSTESATLSQEIYPKLRFQTFKDNIKSLGADGIIVAHTGSLIGFLYSKEPSLSLKTAARNFINDQGIAAMYGEIF